MTIPAAAVTLIGRNRRRTAMIPASHAGPEPSRRSRGPDMRTSYGSRAWHAAGSCYTQAWGSPRFVIG